jgi:hypothetical protein
LHPRWPESATSKPPGLSSPISRKWAGFAEIPSEGIKALPPGALMALTVSALLGVVLAVLESAKTARFLAFSRVFVDRLRIDL